jgi:hypothetical protein
LYPFNTCDKKIGRDYKSDFSAKKNFTRIKERIMVEKKKSTEAIVGHIRRKTRRKYSAEEKIRIILDGLRGETTIAELCRVKGINKNL